MGLLGALVALALAAAPAGAALAPCNAKTAELCGTIPVPLDYTGAVPGTVNLAVREVPAQTPAAGTVFFVSGGPGQAAIPLFLGKVSVFFGALPNFNYVTIDQRGTGLSGGLTCKGSLVTCGKRLGAQRQFYRTEDSVKDIEAVRQTLGLGPLSLVGVSYGGRVLGEYARAFPASTARIVLDSPVTLAGSNQFDLQRHAALRRVAASLCGGGACAGVTKHPYGDLVKLAGRLAKKSRKVIAYDAKGHRHKARFTRQDLYGIVVSSDLNPLSRAELPAAISSALRGDYARLVRLVTETAVGEVDRPVAKPAELGVSDLLYDATSCAEGSFPWNPASAPGAGRAKLLVAAAKTLGAKAFSPWGLDLSLSGTAVPDCVNWPSVVAPPVASGVSPIPALVLSGTEDLRTPLEQSGAIAQGYSTKQVLPIPYTGHSTISSDFSGCALKATLSFIAQGTAPAACPATHRIPSTAPRAPLSIKHLKARLAKGRKGQTVTGAELTVSDIFRELEAATGAFRQAGLHGGRLAFTGTVARLAGYTYVPGLTLTGKLTLAKAITGTLKIGGRTAVHGRVRLTAGPRILFSFPHGKKSSIASVIAGTGPAFLGLHPTPHPAFASP